MPGTSGSSHVFRLIRQIRQIRANGFPAFRTSQCTEIPVFLDEPKKRERRETQSLPLGPVSLSIQPGGSDSRIDGVEPIDAASAGNYSYCMNIVEKVIVFAIGAALAAPHVGRAQALPSGVAVSYHVTVVSSGGFESSWQTSATFIPIGEPPE